MTSAAPATLLSQMTALAKAVQGLRAPVLSGAVTDPANIVNTLTAVSEVLAILDVFFPELALPAECVAVLIALIALYQAEGGKIIPDPDPEVDAQNHTGSGR